MRRVTTVVVACVLAAAACGCNKNSAGAGSGSAGGGSAGSAAAAGSAVGSAAGSVAGSAAGSAAAAGTAAGSARAKLAAALGKLANASKALSKGALGPVVRWQELAPFLPDKLGTLPAVEPVHGKEQSLGPMKVATVGRSYGVKKSAKIKGTRARVQIIDTAQAPVMRAAVGMGGKFKRSGDTTTETTTIGGHHALVRWHRPTMTAKLSVLVGGRFLINMGVRPVRDGAAGKALIAKLDLAKLASLAAAKAKALAKAKGAASAKAGSGTGKGHN